ncbi:UNVERIFIED_CONTAM: tRNA selenocysteine 1-associated protein 1, partial [Siphonaria sp. JEL0065]
MSYTAANPAGVTLDPSKTTLWMGELEPWMDENYIRQLWNSIGENVTVKMIRDKMTGQSAGYCFVDFGNNTSAGRQLATLQGSMIPGTNRVFRLNWASGGGLVDRRENIGQEFSIFVGDLGQEVNDIVLLNTFQARYESVKSARVVLDPMTGMSRGYGFVKFASDLDSQRAMTEMNGQFCGSRPMRINIATQKNKMQQGQGGSGGPGMGGPQGQFAQQGYYGFNAAAMQQMQQQMIQQQQLQQQQQQGGAVPPQQPGKNPRQPGVPLQGQPFGAVPFHGGPPGIFGQFPDPNNTTVFIGGLSPAVGDDELRSHFGQFGEIVYTKIPPGKGCGFVQYSTRQSAEYAIQAMNNAIIGGNRVRLSWGKSQAALKDPLKLDTVDQLNANYLAHNEDAIEMAEAHAAPA